MGISFTPSQQKVIDTHEKNILVSAAAGSGKTAVLVQRIIEMISRKDNPVDIDRLLIVTFTQAAAAEMRERISIAISKRLEEEPNNSHLQRQATLIHNAQINTIDSFCLFVVRNHFDKIGIDPAFRVADQGEMIMLKKEVFASLLEERYADGNADFLEMIECFSTDRGDDKIEEMVLNLYDYAMSYPFPKSWLSQRKKDYEVEDVEDLLKTEWMQILCEQGKEQLVEAKHHLEQAQKVVHEPDGPYMYGDLIDNEIEMMNKCLQAEKYEDLAVACSAVKFERLSSKKDPSVSTEQRDLAQKLRAKAKEINKNCAGSLFAKALTAIVADMQTMSPVIEQLVSMTEDFLIRFSEAKREKNLVDFNDMEHFTLKILVEEKADGSYETTAVAKEYQEYFTEIMIDEYQDSNLVQETLLKSISKEEKGQFNRFMVGDVKQSIYRFRLSEPRLFMEKMATYQKNEDTKELRIDLNQNFRSREEVLRSCNRVFEKVMCEELGGVPYEEDVRLNLGAQYPELNQSQTTEVCVLSMASKEDEEDEETEDKKELEAKMIAGKIQSMVGKFEVKDGDQIRKARFSDVVILLRSPSSWGDTMRNTLMDYGIPVYVASKTGYFNALEVNTVLQLLLVLDNPRQDIPLFVTLHSPIFGFTDEELALIKALYQGDSLLLYDALCEENESLSAEIQNKKQAFLAFLEKYRKRASYVSIHVLIDEILEDTNYLHYVAALPAGAQRKANLLMLLERATEFERTSYRGLFRFVRYIEQLKDYEIDYGEADLSDETADAVRIMTIHGSKGLEFPICFVSGMGKGHNLTDTTERFLMDMRLGIAVDYWNPKLRVKANDLRKKVISQQMKEDSLGEELRVLYVAMTRAKEKLILTGYVGDFEKRMGELQQLCQGIPVSEHYRKFQILSGKSYLDWILMTLCAGEEDFSLQVYTKQELEQQMVKETMDEVSLQARLTMRKPGDGIDESLSQNLKNVFSFVYPYQNLEKLYTKTTVSELKKAAAHDQEEDGEQPLFQDLEKTEIIPKFMETEEKMAGNERGTAYHRAMELMDFTKDYTLPEIKEQLQFFVETKKMTQLQVNAIKYKRIQEFMDSEPGKRMQQAARQNLLFREQPFVYGLSAKRLKEEFPEDETVLIQGIVDVFWEENGELVILDYKTDALKQPEDFVKRYQIQLSYYAEALENITGKRVKEMIIYAFGLGDPVGIIPVEH